MNRPDAMTAATRAPGQWACPLCGEVQADDGYVLVGVCLSDACVSSRRLLRGMGFTPLPELEQARGRGAEA